MRKLLLCFGLVLLPAPCWAAVAFDAYTASSSGTGDISFTHTPVGTPRGVIVYVLCNGSATDEITSITYGGTSMTETAESPTTNSTGELGSSHCFFLGSSISAGAQTVAVTTSGTATTKIAGCVTLTANQDTSVVDTSSLVSNNQVDPSVTLSLGGITCFAMLGAWSGIGNGTIAPLTNWTERMEFDYGNQEAYIATYDTVGSSDVTAGYTAGGDDVALHAIAVRENAAAGTTRSYGVILG